jgi:hypothetical protein
MLALSSAFDRSGVSRVRALKHLVVTVDVAVHFEFREFVGWHPNQIRAFMRGIADVVSAGRTLFKARTREGRSHRTNHEKSAKAKARKPDDVETHQTKTLHPGIL